MLQITWYREGVLIEKSERFRTELRTELGQPHHSSLTILDAHVEDAGNYRVLVRNEFGETEVTISLVVTGECTAPSSHAVPPLTVRPAWSLTCWCRRHAVVKVGRGARRMWFRGLKMQGTSPPFESDLGGFEFDVATPLRGDYTVWMAV